MKKWYTSKTLWVNALVAVLAIAQALQGQAWFDPAIQIFIVAVANALLRFVTSTPIGK